MQEIVGVRFTVAGRIYSFAPRGKVYKVGERVIVETENGNAIGIIAQANSNIEDDTLLEPLKDVIRKTTESDEKRNDENKLESAKILVEIKQKVEECGYKMKVVSAYYTFDRSKIMIEFTSEERVDFRNLLKDLASKYHSRIELRQIGDRDEVKQKGGLGPCGNVCCCKMFLNDFDHVTVKMAKNQGLSLNPTKISGLCGRLMCCLSYENKHYAETLKIMPKIMSEVETKEGKGVVVYNNLLKELVTVRIRQNDDTFITKEFPVTEITFKTIENGDNNSYKNNRENK
ncbi:MAG: regulatory iron-sulfur-containing complex subunit RicT [Clostridia bacterium]